MDAANNTYLTPIATVMFIFALCTAYMFLAMNASKHVYVGDYKFVLFKVMMVISTIGLGFLATVTSVSYYYFIISWAGQEAASGAVETLNSYDFTNSGVITTLLLYLSSLWMAVAIALLPFGHTVYNRTDNTIDVDATNQLSAVQQAVYSGPYYVLMVFASLNLFAFFVMISHLPYNPIQVLAAGENADENAGKTPNAFTKALTIMGKTLAALRPTLGCYFRLDNDQWKAVLTTMAEE